MPSAGPPLDARLLRFRSNPRSEDPRTLAQALLSARRPSDVLEVTVTGLELLPDDPDLMVIQARAWIDEGDPLRAQAVLLQAARVAPKRKEPFRWLAEVLISRGDTQRAVKVLERASAIDPSDPDVRALIRKATAQPSTMPGGALAPTAPGSLIAGKPPRPQVGAFAPMEEAPTKVASAHAVGARFPATPVPPAPPRNRGAAMPPGRASGPSSPMRPPRAAVPSFPAAPQRPVALPAADPVVKPAVEPVRFEPQPVSVAPPPLRRSTAPSPAAPAFKPGPPRSGFDEETTNDLSPALLAHLQQKPRASAPAGPPSRRPPDARRMPSGVWSEGPAAPAEARRSNPPDKAPSGVWVFPDEPAPAHAPAQAGQAPTNGAGHALAVGTAVGVAEDVEQVLHMLGRAGVFEQPGSQGGAAAEWVSKKESKRRGVRVGWTLFAIWFVAVGSVVGGYFGWQEYIASRHRQAAALRRQAEEQALGGDHSNLVDAERNLRFAYDLDPNDETGQRLLLFVHSQRALEDGAFDPGFLLPTIARGERMHVDPPYPKVARAIVLAAQGNFVGARAALGEALASAPDDPAILYVSGRLEQRLGGEEALARLAAAVQKQPALNAAAIALAEARADEGQREEANQLIAGVLGRASSHLRGRLWKQFLETDEANPDTALAALDAMAEALRRGAPTDRVLEALVRARLLRRKGQLGPAAESVERAAEAGATEPRLLALVATEARTLGRLSRAQLAASAAVAGAPSNDDFRKLLAQIQIDRHNGVRALESLRGLSTDDPDVLRLSAHAALLVGTEDALRATVTALDAAILANGTEPSTELNALRLRARASLGEAEAVLPQAQALVRESPGDPSAALALGEVALSLRNAALARTALESLVEADPNNADGHYLLGRARRLSGDAQGAEESFRRAVDLLPEFVEPRVTLGELLLDRGDFAHADEIYTALVREAGVASGFSTSLAGRTGRVRVLLGLGRVDDARVQLEGIRQEDRNLPSVQVVQAMLSIARNEPGAAITAIRTIAEADGARAQDMALYGDALAAAGQADPASTQYDRALGTDSGLPEALLGKAALAVRAENVRQAEDYLDRADDALGQRIRPPGLRARLLVLRGRVHLLAGPSRAEAAVTVLRQAAAIAGAPAEAHFYLGEALSGDAAAARAAYQRYLELEPAGRHASRARRAMR